MIRGPGTAYRRTSTVTTQRNGGSTTATSPTDTNGSNSSNGHHHHNGIVEVLPMTIHQTNGTGTAVGSNGSNGSNSKSSNGVNSTLRRRKRVLRRWWRPLWSARKQTSAAPGILLLLTTLILALYFFSYSLFFHHSTRTHKHYERVSRALSKSVPKTRTTGQTSTVTIDNSNSINSNRINNVLMDMLPPMPPSTLRSALVASIISQQSMRLAEMLTFDRTRIHFAVHPTEPVVNRPSNPITHEDVHEYDDDAHEHHHSDYGNLDFRYLEYPDQPRVVYHDELMDKGEIRRYTGDDFVEGYFAFDDDHERNTYKTYKDKSIAKERLCRRVKWHRNYKINCNSFHELDLAGSVLEHDSKFLGQGAYRQVFTAGTGDERFVHKQCTWENEDTKFNRIDYEAMRMDMLVGEIFSSNPYFVDIYGYCALSMFSEFMPYGDASTLAQPAYERGSFDKTSEEIGVERYNELTPKVKLVWAYEMAKSVSYLHNYPGGVIVHDDIQLPQFLIKDDGHLKLNDFNRAEPMLFDEANQEYCRYLNNPGHGDWRAPEEYFDYPLDEKIDVWSLCNNFYALLTGVSPFPEMHSSTPVKKAVKEGKTGYIDPKWHEQSFPERKLAEIIPKCFAFNADDRIDINELVALLKDAIDEYEKILEKEGNDVDGEKGKITSRSHLLESIKKPSMTTLAA